MNQRVVIKFKNTKDPAPIIENGIRCIFECLQRVLSLDRKQLEDSFLYQQQAPKIERLPDDCLFGFTSDTTLRLRFFSITKIAPNLDYLGLKPHQKKGWPLPKLNATSNQLAQRIQTLPLMLQKGLLKDILANDAVFQSRIWAQGNVLDFSSVRDIAQAPKTFNSKFNDMLLAEACKKRGALQAPNHNINLAVLWLALYFFHNGYIDFVDQDFLSETRWLARAYYPFNGAIFLLLLGSGKHDILREITRAKRGKRQSVTSALKLMLLNREFIKASKPEEYLDALYHIKMDLEARGKLHDGIANLLNICHKTTVRHFQLPYNEAKHIDFFGGGARYRSPYSHGLFSWVLHPQQSRLPKFSEYAGFEMPNPVPRKLKRWAEQLADIVPDYQNSGVQAVAKALNLWLVYLFMLAKKHPKEFPASLSEVARNRHIAHSSKYFTFINFLSELNLSPHSKDGALAVLEKTFALLDSKHDLGLSALPINRKFDKFTPPHKRRFSTTRQAIPLELFRIIIDENRKDDFAFAKSLEHGKLQRKLYERYVLDTETGEYKFEFFPAIPTALDLILTSGARLKDALTIDSGEGDQILYSADGRAKENFLNTASSDRQLGVLKAFNISATSEELVVPGLFFISSKTGPYSVPYVDPSTAKLLENMREWQIRYFPIVAPVKLMSILDRQAQNHAMFADTFPLFRDPENGVRYTPPSGPTLREYWKKLLQHCENIYQQKTGKRGAFTRDGEPKWDIHSIRVTNITVLLENGMPPHIVALLVGHKSLLMTLHYRAPTTKSIHEKMVEAQRVIEEELLEALSSSSTEDKILDSTWDKYSAQLFATNDGREMLKQISKQKTPPDIFIHGICPGASCSIGQSGNRRGGGAVFRPRACSKCRFRITGPAFLNGLVLRYNSLIAEFKLSIDKEKQLRERIESAERAKDFLLVKKLSLNASGVEYERDNLLEELAIEYQTIQKCLQIPPEDSNALVTYDKSALEVIHEEVNDFTLIQNVIFNTKHFHDAEHEIPAGLTEKRTKILRKIAKANNLEGLYFKLTEEQHSTALEAFCNMLARSTQLEEIISGEIRLAEIAELKDALDTMQSNTAKRRAIDEGHANETK